jgi:hypothetical protein
MKKQLHNEKKLLSTLAKKLESTKTVVSNKQIEHDDIVD